VQLIDVAARRPVAVQLVLPPTLAPFDAMRAALGHLGWHDASNNGPRGGGRLAGFTAPHRTFGWAPPQVLRQRYATTAAMADEPALAAALTALGAAVWPLVAQHLPEAAAAHQVALQRAISRRWVIGDHWTSGIVNRTVALPYHRDRGNVTGCLSAMVCWRQGVAGGFLHLPDYGVSLAVPDRSLVVFSGATVTHGVTPLDTPEGAGHRYTAVWYVRAGLGRSAPTWAAEVARAQLAATSHDQAPA